jgi:PAS domain-containing protein
MFELAPVSLWLEDYSALKQLLDRWRAEGVTDLQAHFAAHPDALQQCSAALRVVRVNQRTLDLFGAQDQQAFLGRLGDVFRDDMHAGLSCELQDLWNGSLSFANRTANYTLDGRRLDVQIRGRILPGHEDRWDCVLVSLEDVTAEVRSTRQLHRSEQYARDLFEYSPVSLWVEDFSAIKRLLDDVRAQGISDFATFLKVHPEFVSRCMQEIRVVDVNRQTLRMFGATDKLQLLSRLGRIFRDEMIDSFAEQLQDLWSGSSCSTAKW